jgi:sugar phosphate isomerase/epimerase
MEGIELAWNLETWLEDTYDAWVERLGKPADVGICLDTVNSFGALEGPEAVLEARLPYTINLHVKDFVIRRHTHQMGFGIEGAPAGEGRLDIPAVLGRVAKLSYPVDAISEL